MSERKKFVFRQHIPSFVDAGEPFTLETDSFEDVLQNKFVQGFSKDWMNGDSPDEIYPFAGFSISDDRHLMAEYGDKERHWVVGYVSGPIKEIKLPRYDPLATPKKFKDSFVFIENGWNKGSYAQVAGINERGAYSLLVRSNDGSWRGCAWFDKGDLREISDQEKTSVFKKEIEKLRLAWGEL